MIVYIGVERGLSHFKMFHTITKQEKEEERRKTANSPSILLL